MASLLETVALIAPNIEVVRHTSLNANKDSEQEKFDKIKESIEEAAATGAEEVVIAEAVEDLYVQLLKDAGYNVCVGPYNNTQKICTLIEWRDSYAQKWYEFKNYRQSSANEIFSYIEIKTDKNVYLVELEDIYNAMVLNEDKTLTLSYNDSSSTSENRSTSYEIINLAKEETCSSVQGCIIESVSIKDEKPSYIDKKQSEILQVSS